MLGEKAFNIGVWCVKNKKTSQDYWLFQSGACLCMYQLFIHNLIVIESVLSLTCFFTLHQLENSSLY